MNQPIRLAIVGTGVYASKRHWPVLQRLKSEFEIVALVNRSPDKARPLTEAITASTGRRPPVYTDLESMLNGEAPEAVVLILPPSANPDSAEAALSHGCHVLAEKPIAISLAEGQRMIAWGEKYRRTFMIAENFRYVGGYERAAALIHSGAIGRPIQARWHVYSYVSQESPYYATLWRKNPLHPGGFLSDSGVHNVAAWRMVMGEPEWISSEWALQRPDLAPADTLSAAIRFESGAIGSFAITHAVPGPDSPFEVAGEKGVLMIGRERVTMWRDGATIAEWDEPREEMGTVAMYRDFAAAIRTGSTPRSTPAEALADLRFIVAILLGGETGRRIRVADVV